MAEKADTIALPKGPIDERGNAMRGSTKSFSVPAKANGSEVSTGIHTQQIAAPKPRIRDLPQTISPEKFDDFLITKPVQKDGRWRNEPVQDLAVEDMRSVSKFAWDAADKIEAAHAMVMKQSGLTEVGRHAKSREMSLAVAANVAKKLDAAKRRTAEAIRKLEEKIAAPPPAGDPAIIAAMRARLPTMKPAERKKVIHDAIKNNDAATMFATLAVPGWMIGERDHAHNLRLCAWQRVTFPNEFNRIRRLKHAQRVLDIHARSFMGWVDGLTNSHLAKKSATEEAKANAAIEAARKLGVAQ
jgi:hypothetical protein